MDPKLQLYSPIYTNTTGSSNTFSLFVSADYYVMPKRTTFYYGFDIPKPGIHKYQLPFYPASLFNVKFFLTYPDVGTIKMAPLQTTTTYRGAVYRVMQAISDVDDSGTTTLPLPAPKGYFNEQTGKVIIESTDDTYDVAYNTGPTEVYAAGYIVKPYFAHDFYANDITIDFGDDTSETYQYLGQQSDTFTHTYSSKGAYTISATAQFVTGSDVSQYITLTSQFSSAIVITGDDI